MFIEVLGWVGVVGTLAAYLMSANGRLASGSVRYAALNAVGGLLCAVAAGVHGAWPSMASSAIWSAVGLHALFVCLATRVRSRGLVVRARFGRDRERGTVPEGSLAC